MKHAKSQIFLAFSAVTLLLSGCASNPDEDNQSPTEESTSETASANPSETQDVSTESPRMRMLNKSYTIEKLAREGGHEAEADKEAEIRNMTIDPDMQDAYNEKEALYDVVRHNAGMSGPKSAYLTVTDAKDKKVKGYFSTGGDYSEVWLMNPSNIKISKGQEIFVTVTGDVIIDHMAEGETEDDVIGRLKQSEEKLTDKWRNLEDQFESTYHPTKDEIEKMSRNYQVMKEEKALKEGNLNDKL